MSRREALRSIARCAALGGLGAAGIALAAKRLSKTKSEKCPGDGPCRNCPALLRCTLPRAVAAKR